MEDETVHRFRLFVAGSTHNSIRASSNLARFCRIHLPGRHSIDIVDVFQQPAVALEERVFLTPTLVRLEPGPVRRIVGTLSEEQPLRDALGLPPAPDETAA